MSRLDSGYWILDSRRVSSLWYRAVRIRVVSVDWFDRDIRLSSVEALTILSRVEGLQRSCYRGFEGLLGFGFAGILLARFEGQRLGELDDDPTQGAVDVIDAENMA